MLDLAAAPPDVLVLVGTQTGNSEIVADAISERLGELGFAVHLLDMAEAVPEDLAGYRQLVAVTCTWSNGTFPDNAVDWFEGLTALAPDLAHLAVGVVGLGDRDYDPFYQTAALRLLDTLTGYGAHAIGPLYDIDSPPTPPVLDAARAWADRAADAFARHAGAR
jgi:flavodoxin